MEGKINSRNKGNKAERVVAQLLSTWTGYKFSRTHSSGGLQWKSQNSKGDIVCTEDKRYFPFCIEVKSHKDIDFSHLLNPKIKNIAILDFWAQCERDAIRAEKIPLLFMRYNSLPANFFFVVMEYELFDFCILPFFNPEAKFFEYQSKKHHLIIIPSTWLLGLSYKRLRLPFKNYNQNYKEIIKPIPYNRLYLISNRGYIITPRKKIVWGNINGHGAKITVIPGKKGRKTITIYRLVAMVFVKNPKNKPVVNHIKAVKAITDARNLEWVTYQENSNHYWANVDYGYSISKINLDTQEVEGTYNSPIEAARSVGKNSGSTISKVLLNKRKSAYNFGWIKNIPKLNLKEDGRCQ